VPQRYPAKPRGAEVSNYWRLLSISIPIKVLHPLNKTLRLAGLKRPRRGGAGLLKQAQWLDRLGFQDRACGNSQTLERGKKGRRQAREACGFNCQRQRMC
jgi:hypothetical protein